MTISALQNRCYSIPIFTLVVCFVAGCGVNTAALHSNSYLTLSSASPYLATVVIGTSPGYAVSPEFLGLANEWGGGREMMGSSETGINTIYRALIGNLTAYGGGPMVIRIGGNSTDSSGEPLSNTALPFAETASALGAHFYLGVNLGSDDPILAWKQAGAYIKEMPSGSLDAIEIGNEPDLYASQGLRSGSYGFKDYLSDFNIWKQNISPLLPPGTKLLGASWADVKMLSNTTAYASAEHSILQGFSQHFYPGDRCKGSLVIPENFLLLDANATSGASQVASAVSAVHAYGLPFRIGEINSIACDSNGGLSDTFSSALWAIDTMFEYANVGVDGVNWHFSNGEGGAPFSFDISTANGKTSYRLDSVNPLYYGMLFFQQATQRNSRLLPVQVGTNANLKGWATKDSSGTIRLALINKDIKASGIIDVYVPGSRRATIATLAAPSYWSSKGVTFAGQTFDGSPDGAFQGVQSTETVAGEDGYFEISMSSTTAALITFEK